MTESGLAIFLPSLRGGGAQRVAVDLANGLAVSNQKVHLLVASDDEVYRHLLDGRVGFECLGMARVVQTIPRLARWLSRNRPEGLLTIQRSAALAAFTARGLSTWRGRIFARETNSYAVDAAAHVGVKRRLRNRLVRWVYRHLDGVIAPSQGLADELAGDCRAVVIPNPVVLPEYSPDARRARPFILAVGRLEHQKRFDDLLGAFALLAERRGPDVPDLVILGEGSLRGRLLELAHALGIADRVMLPGFDPDPFRYMRAAEAFVLSSAREGLPNVLIQAMACGCPVVATDCPHGPREILGGGRWGRLVPVGDVTALADAIASVLEAGRVPFPAEALAPYQPSRVVQRYRELLLEAR